MAENDLHVEFLTQWHISFKSEINKASLVNSVWNTHIIEKLSTEGLNLRTDESSFRLLNASKTVIVLC